MITIQFLGAAGTVTGSKFAMRVDGHTTLVDCGLFQGLREVRQRNWDSLPIDAGSIGEVLLTHAHVDHSGYLPRSRRDGYHGDVMATHATKDLLRILLPDSGHLQEEEARYRNEVGATKYRPALPLYTAADGADAASHVTGDWEQRVPLGERAMATFHRAGHILGAASVHLDIRGAAGIRRTSSLRGTGAEMQHWGPLATAPRLGDAAERLGFAPFTHGIGVAPSYWHACDRQRPDRRRRSRQR